MINTMEDLRNITIRPIADAPRNVQVASRGYVIVMRGPKGGVYSNYPVEYLRGQGRYKHSQIVACFVALGLASGDLFDELKFAEEKRERRDRANYLLGLTDDFAQAGAPLTKTQIKRLEWERDDNQDK